jgi:hypothetical protein
MLAFFGRPYFWAMRVAAGEVEGLVLGQEELLLHVLALDAAMQGELHALAFLGVVNTS